MTRWRYRPFQTAAVLVLAALLTACLCVAPLYTAAMRQAITRVTVERADVLTTSVQVTLTPADRARVAAPEDLVAALPDRLRRDLERPVLGYQATAGLYPEGTSQPVGPVLWREGMCEHVTMLAGRCPAAAGEIAVTPGDREAFGWRPGSHVAVTGDPQVVRGHVVATSVRLAVVGVYAPRDPDYWFGRQLDGRAGLLDPGPPSHVQHDSWLADRASFERASAPLAEVRSSAGFALPPTADATSLLGLGRLLTHPESLVDEKTLRDPRQRWSRDLPRIDVVTGIPDLADEVTRQVDQAAVTVPLLFAQLGLLAMVVLWLVVSAMAEQRRPEVALMRLRGRGRRGALGLLLAEMVPITLAGLLPGALLAIGATWLARTAVLPGEAPFELGIPFAAAAALAAVALVLTPAAAADRVTREPVVDLLRRVPARRAGWRLGVSEAVLLASAAALVLTFASGGLTGPAALVAPGLLGVVVGLLLGHLVAPAFAGLGRRLLARGRMPWALGLLDAARSPSTRRVVAVVTVAAAIAVFSADALLIGARNRASAAEQEAGARMVTYVEGADVVGVRDALTAADPDGVDTTPVVRVSAPGAGAVETLAVEPDSFRSVALFPGAAPSEALWNRLAAPDSSPIALVGSRASLEVRGSSLTSVLIGGRRSAVAVGLDLLGDAGRAVHVELGRIAPAQRHATLTAAVPCRQGCQVVGLWFGSLPGARVRGAATVSALTQLPAGTRVELGSAVHWSGDDGDGPAPVTLTDGAEGLDVRVRGDGGAVLSARHDWVLSEVPVLATTSLRQPVDTATTIAGLDGEDRAARVAGLLTRVPGSARQMYVANLDTMLRGPAAGPTARVEIWYARADPELRRRVLAALDERGIRASGTTSLDDVRRGYDESASAWSLQLAVLVGAASLLIALLVLVVSAASSWRLRTRDLAALRMTGAGAAMLRRSAVVGQLPAVLVAGVVGGAAGALGARLAMPLVPLFATPPEVSTLDLHTPWAGVAVVLAGVLAGLSVGSLLIGRALARAADVSLLRESVP